jgi:hypothetical protein
VDAVGSRDEEEVSVALAAIAARTTDYALREDLARLDV